MKKEGTQPLTENEKALIEALVDADMPDRVIIAMTSGLEDEQLPEMTEYIREELRTKQKVTEENLVKIHLILAKEAGNL